MIQQQRQPEVQTLEDDELSRLLRREYVPTHRERPEVFRTPSHLLPSRWQIIDRIILKHGHCPNPDLDIVYGATFENATVPSAGKLYINCQFFDCDFGPPDAPYEFIDCTVEGLTSWRRLMSEAIAKRIGIFKGNVEL